MGKRCANCNSLRALERVLRSLGRWKNINFLKSSPRRAEVQILEKTLCKPTTVYFTTLTAWLVPTDSVYQVWCHLLLYLLRNWLKQTAQEGAQEGEFYEVLWDCLNTLFKEWGQIAAHHRNQCKFIVLLPKKRAWALFAVCQNLGWHVKNSPNWNTVISNVCTVLKFHLVTSAQISYYSRVPQLTWDCVVDFEADPAILPLALASGVFFKWIWKNPKNIWKTSDLWLDPNTPILDSFSRSVHQSGSAVYLPARYNPWNYFWLFLDVHGHCISLRFHRDENWESEKKVISTCWKPVETPSLNSH